jgi:hypothetical protein
VSSEGLLLRLSLPQQAGVGGGVARPAGRPPLSPLLATLWQAYRGQETVMLLP